MEIRCLAHIGFCDSVSIRGFRRPKGRRTGVGARPDVGPLRNARERRTAVSGRKPADGRRGPSLQGSGEIGGGVAQLLVGVDLGEEALGFVEGGLVAMRRAVALGAFLGGLGVGAGGGEVAGVEVEPGQQVVDVGLLKTVLAAVGDAQGFLGVMAGGVRLAFGAVPTGPGEQNVGLELDQVDVAAAGEGFGEVLFGFGKLLVALVRRLRRQGLTSPAEQPFGLDDVAFKALDVGEFARVAGGFEGGLRIAHEQGAEGAVGPNYALPLR